MTTDPIPSDITSPHRLDPTKRVGDDRSGPGMTSSFQSYMETSKGTNPLASSPTTSLSPFDLAHGNTVLTATPTFDTLINQAKVAQISLGDVSNQLSTPQLKLKQTHKLLLRNKLTEANTNLRAANAKMGLSVSDKEEEEQPSAGPVQKFLGYVAGGQSMLNSAVQQLNDLKDKGTSLSPADFLLIQLKMNKAQQAIEYSSVLLSKVIDDIRTLMNIQL